MIKSKSDLTHYLEQDRQQLGRKLTKPKPFTDPIWHFQILLRNYEYHNNVKSNKFYLKYLKLRFRRMSIRLGFPYQLMYLGPA